MRTSQYEYEYEYEYQSFSTVLVRVLVRNYCATNPQSNLSNLSKFHPHASYSYSEMFLYCFVSNILLVIHKILYILVLVLVLVLVPYYFLFIKIGTSDGEIGNVQENNWYSYSYLCSYRTVARIHPPFRPCTVRKSTVHGSCWLFKQATVQYYRINKRVV